jgi:hypothetical protein
MHLHEIHIAISYVKLTFNNGIAKDVKFTTCFPKKIPIQDSISYRNSKSNDMKHEKRSKDYL